MLPKQDGRLYRPFVEGVRCGEARTSPGGRYSGSRGAGWRSVGALRTKRTRPLRVGVGRVIGARTPGRRADAVGARLRRARGADPARERTTRRPFALREACPSRGGAPLYARTRPASSAQNPRGGTGAPSTQSRISRARAERAQHSQSRRCCGRSRVSTRCQTASSARLRLFRARAARQRSGCRPRCCLPPG